MVLMRAVQVQVECVVRGEHECPAQQRQPGRFRYMAGDLITGQRGILTGHATGMRG